MHPSNTRARMLAGAGLVLLVAGGLLAWRVLSHDLEALAAIRMELDERTRERDRLLRELADERQRLHALEQVWSARLELARSEKAAADRKLKECEGREAGGGTRTRTLYGGRF